MLQTNFKAMIYWFNSMRRPVRVLLCVIALIFIHVVICFYSLFVRLHTLACLGNSEAMYLLGRDYMTYWPKIVFYSDQQKGYDLLIRSAQKGNEHAIKKLVSMWRVLDKRQVVFWLKYGIGFDRPWCAEELSRAYEFGLYGLERNPVKASEYRILGDRLRAEGKGDRWDH